MKVLLIGSGAREHALAWKLVQSPRLSALWVAPGNPGTATVARNVALDITDHAQVISFAKEQAVDLVVIGPDDVLASGMADVLTREGIRVFGPTKAAAEIEWSKAYAKELMEAAGIPTARSKTCKREEDALAYVRAQGAPIVVKASGLALGKGVTVALTLEEAEVAVRECFAGKFGSAGEEVVIEEYLTGLEISTHALCVGVDARMFPSAMDHKRVGEKDTGPNTGGMGTVAPVPGVSDSDLTAIRDLIVLPLLQALAVRGRPFSGILFPGIMLTAQGPKVLEFNARFGDPETESYMRLLTSDLLEVLTAVADGTLPELSWRAGYASCVMLASEGYPGAYEKGQEITVGATTDPDVVIFHAGTREEEGRLLTSGGRVLGVSSVGDTLSEALTHAYNAISKISFSGMHFRKDIGERALARLQSLGDT